MQEEDVGQTGRHRSLAWQFFKYPQTISLKEEDAQSFGNRIKTQLQSEFLNCVFTFKMKIDCIRCLSELLF